MRLRSFHLAGAALLALASFGCSPSIGDSCQLHSDCSQTGDRICDPTLPGGYCTVFNCLPGSCPEEAVCVGFYTEPASLSECRDPSESRFERTFCMKTCGSTGDCRGGYQCLPVGADGNNPVGAVVLESGDVNRSVCAPAFPKAADGDAGTRGQVCNPPDATFPELGRWVPPDAGAVPDGGDGSVRAVDAGVDSGTGREGGP
ncbi:MAG TPA: hypothetical protein VHE30_16355 [Polyangiaceae bacterium]|nr:hypothetical protein [Polyangiaceae bacterium]